MAIEFYHFFKDDCSPYVNIHDFESNFIKEFGFVKDVVVYMIHQPFLNNVIDTNIDLLLIVAVENKEKNYYPIKDKFYKDANGNDRKIYLNNIVMPIKFIDEFKYNSVKIYDTKEERNYGVCIDDEIETDFATEISTLRYGTEQFFKNVLDNVEIKCLPVIWILSNVREKYYFPTHNIVRAYQFGFYEWEAFLKFGYNKFFNSNAKWSEPNDEKSYQLLFENMEKIKQVLEDESKISILTKKKIDRIALQDHK
ncbi:hypothetical protein ACFPVS_05275 [Neisseria weixii]|uniref:hypothetical protein n=1 Tax=Neisseria weixii TaxID=1853276 RepID=UPI000BB69E9B|nr:hypothetical protein [Neisseria weixii]ATD64283.1 hypothetical protein CGZ65_01180 [Neisseria weixii]